jgi:stage II sporulation protein D
MRILRLTAVLSLLLLIPAGCSRSVNIDEKAPLVRVRILENQDRVTLSSVGASSFKSASERDIRRLDLGRGTVTVSLSPAGWQVGNVSIGGGELTIQPPAPGAVAIGGQAYRGRYRFVPVAADRFDVINDVDLDGYLMSVVSKELLKDWLDETYKAQAIVARTYALYEARVSAVSAANRGFDLNDDQRSQVYGGISAETDKSREAVLATSGVVVAYGPKGQEKIFKAYFSSCCGGVGQSAYDAFGDPDIVPLRAKNVGSLCNASPRFNWPPVILPKDELTRRIRAWGARRNRPEKDLGNLVRVDIAPNNLTPRPVRFILTDSRGLQYSLTGEELRWACNSDANGGPTLNSSFVTPVTDRDTIQFVEGHGWGHGVGMCQWCAQSLAQRGQRHEDIVRFSFPGAVLVRAY